MSRKRRKFTPEFKIEAVRRVEEVASHSPRSRVSSGSERICCAAGGAA